VTKLSTFFAGRRTNPRLLVGLIVLTLIAGALIAALSKQQIKTWFSGGDYRTIQLSGNHFLSNDVSTVKVSGVPVGVVHDVQRAGNGTALVTVKVDDQALDALGSAPSADVRPTTLLGGKYYIDLHPGGDRNQAWQSPVPPSRTHLPVEVGDVAETLQPDARQGVSSTVRQLDNTLGSGGTDAVQQLVRDAPGTLGPGSNVLNAAQGAHPQNDLSRMVSNLHGGSDALTAQQGQMESILDDANTTARNLGDTSKSVAAAINQLPATLDSSDAGLRRLHTTLLKTRDTAGPARPVAQQLGPTLEHLDPVLAKARPVVSDLRSALRDTRPLVRDLVPATQDTTSVLNDIKGPVLNRLQGPINQFVSSPYHGTGPYKDTSGDDPFYKELGYMLSGVDKAGAYVDANGHAVAFQPGIGPGTPSLVGNLSAEQMLQHLLHGGGPR
jgi:phospholipid/cholesterol/gamma-HCH transport system substrate-binding protein